MAKVKITVVKLLNFDEIHADSDLGCSTTMGPVCKRVEEGQVFETDISKAPEGFCPGAFADLYPYISGLRFGANYPWMNEQGTVLLCCTDAFHPVVFRLERIED